MTDARLSRVSAEAVIQTSDRARLSQLSANVIIQTSDRARLSQVAGEVVIQTSDRARLSQLAADIIIQRSDRARLSSVHIEYLIAAITSTSFTEDFDRIDSTTNVGGLWQVVSGTWGLLSNQLYNAGNTAGAIIVLETTQTDGRITYVAPIIGNTTLIFWYVNTTNYYRFDLTTGNLIKKAANVDTTLGTASSTPTNGSVIYIDLKANKITVSYGSTVVLSYTDGSPAKGTKQGVGAGNNAGRGNHFGWESQDAITALGEGWGQVPLK